MNNLQETINFIHNNKCDEECNYEYTSYIVSEDGKDKILRQATSFWTDEKERLLDHIRVESEYRGWLSESRQSCKVHFQVTTQPNNF